jgi:uncharacterized protein
MGELEMRRQDKEIRDPAVLRQILESAVVCRLAMCDGDRPYVVPISFVLEGESLLLHCAEHGRKLDVLRRNPHVCFEVDEAVEVVAHKEACNVGMRFLSVIGTGRVAWVEGAAEKARVVVLRVEIERLTGKRSGR